MEDVGVVGDDAVAEILMARNSGAIGIAVTSGATGAEEWASQPAEKTPHMVIANIGELVKAFDLV